MTDQHFPLDAGHTISDLSTVQTFTTPSNAFGIYVQALSQNVRIKFMGGIPTSSSGFLLIADADPWFIPLKPDTVVKVIQVVSGASLEWQAVS